MDINNMLLTIQTVFNSIEAAGVGMDWIAEFREKYGIAST
jgi:hypothetical protein